MATFSCHPIHPRLIFLHWIAFCPRYVSSICTAQNLPGLTSTSSPRWLLEKNRPEEAHEALIYLRGAEDNHEEVEQELQEIKANVEFHNSITEAPWHVLVTDRDLLARLWRGALLQFMAQMCGATAIKYYLPTVFLALGLSKDLSLMASGIESTLKIGCTIIEMLIIDKLGRKKTLLLGCAIMSVAMIVSLPVYYLVLLPQLTSRLDQRRPASSLPKQQEPCCRLYCNSLHLLLLLWLLCRLRAQRMGLRHRGKPNTIASPSFSSSHLLTPLQIFPTYIRAKGINICASAGAIGSIVVGQFFPVGIQNIGSKTYYIFFAINAASMIIMIIWYPETKGKTLEEMDGLFGKLLTENDVEGHGSNGGTKAHDEGEEGVVEQSVEAQGKQ